MDPQGYLVAAGTVLAAELVVWGGPVQVRHLARPVVERRRGEEALTFFVRLEEISAGCREAVRPGNSRHRGYLVRLEDLVPGGGRKA